MDISKCTGYGCPFKEECYRFTAPKGTWKQSWIDVPLRIMYGKPECDMFKGDRKTYDKIQNDAEDN